MPAAPTKQGGGCSVVAIVLLIGGGLAAVLLVGALVFFMVDLPGGGGGGGTPNKPTTGPINGRFKDLSPEALQGRIESAGYSTINRTVSEGSNFSTTAFTVQRGGSTGQTGSVQLLKYQDARTAGFAEDALRQNNSGSIARDDNTILFIMIFPQDRAAQQALLDKIIK